MPCSQPGRGREGQGEAGRGREGQGEQEELLSEAQAPPQCETASVGQCSAARITAVGTAMELLGGERCMFTSHQRPLPAWTLL